MTENQELSLVEKILKSNVQDMHRGRTKLYTDLASTLPQFDSFSSF